MPGNITAENVCAFCTHPTLRDDAFCPGCGQPLIPAASNDIAEQVQAPASSLCCQCNSSLLSEDTFCSSCGFRRDVPGSGTGPFPVRLAATNKTGPTRARKIYMTVAGSALGAFVLICLVSLAAQGMHGSGQVYSEPSSGSGTYSGGTQTYGNTQTYGSTQTSGMAPSASSAYAPAPAGTPPASSPPIAFSSADEEAESFFSSRGLSPGNYLWCRQTLLNMGASPAAVPRYLKWLSQVSDECSEEPAIVAAAGCKIAVADGDLDKAIRHVQVLAAFSARFPGEGIFQVGLDAASGQPHAAALARIRMGLDGLPGGSLAETAVLANTVEEIALGSSRRRSNP